MKSKPDSLKLKAKLALILSLCPLAPSLTAHAALQVIGTQYCQDHLFPEFFCYYSSGNYPTSCPDFQPGATVYVYLKNTGGASEAISDATIAGYSLKTVIKTSTANYNPQEQASIYFYWDNPPQQILDAGEPVWWKADPATVPVGGVAQVAVRLRYVPTNHISFGVVSSSGTIVTNITVDANVPRVQSISYSEDLKKVNVYWRRNGGAAPTSVWLDGANVTALTTTVNDPSLNLAASVITLPTALSFYSYHVYQGVYADGKTASAGQRAWTNKFIYCTWSTFEETASYTGLDWLEDAAKHGFNNIESNLGAMGGVLGTVSGRNRCQQLGYGYTILDTSKLQNNMDPDLWFINDEPDAQENNQGNTHCGTGTRLPCDSSKYAGTLVIKYAVNFAAELHSKRAKVPITVNLDGGLQPQSFYTWGPAVDVLESDNYYEPRLADAYYLYPNRIPLHGKPKVSYAVARTGTEGAAPNPFRHILFCTQQVDPWPYPFPDSKHIEAYYSLAGGTKGMGFWWFNGPRGLYQESQSPALWKEMGLIGNEIKTARNLIVKSTPVDLTLSANSPWIWARAVASGLDTLILYVVNDNFINDFNGCHITNVANAAVTVTLPAWMQSSPAAFEITKGGAPGDATWTLNGSQMQISLGTLRTVRMIIITTDANLRSATQQRYDTQVKPNLCAFAPELCVNYPPSIGLQPANQSVIPGGTANFTIVAGGTSPLGYRWQKNNGNLANGGHYSGVFTSTLTITGADSNDAANYRCVVTNAFGSTNSANAHLTVTNFISPPLITQQPTNQTVPLGSTVSFAVSAMGTEPLSFQWNKNNGHLNNGGHYSGATTDTLTITGADSGDSASYRCVVTNIYGMSNSASATLTIDLNVCNPSTLLGHGDMEDASGYSVCPDWEKYSAGTSGSPSWVKETTIVHGGSASQKCRNTSGSAGSLLGVRQTFDANIGDAFTFEGWVQPVSNPGAGQQVAMAVSWDGATNNPTAGNATWKISTGARNVWTHLQNLTGNATATSVTLFLDSRRTVSSQDLTAYWDDVVSYRAYVPPPPVVSEATANSLNVDVLPGCNLGNGTCEFAISVGGGAYTLGTHYVQANGTISTTPVWQSDATWAIKAVTGLASGTPYTFKVQARYSSTMPQPTSLGEGTTLTPTVTQPPQFTQQPSPQNVCPGGNAMFSVTATGSGLTYQWQTNGVNLVSSLHYGGITSPTLAVVNVGSSDVVNYRCVVTGAGITNSATAPLTLKTATIITSDPSDQEVAVGANAFFSVNAIGEGALAYQWQSNGVDLVNSTHHSGTTSPTLIVSNATSMDSADYRCVVTGDCGNASSSAVALTVVIPGLCLNTLNADFESGFSLTGGGYIADNWFEWETDPGVVIGYDETTSHHGGDHAQRIRIWGGPGGSSGGAYQQVPVTVGQAYDVGVWTSSGDDLTTCSLGVDPTGGTDGTGVIWSTGSTNTSWVQQTITGAAMGSYITIYLKVTTADDAKRNGYFDDLTPSSSSGPLLLNVQGNGNSLTLTWPECPGAHLERVENLSAPMNWTAVTNEVTVADGQRRVILTPAGNAGYYRLVLD